MDVPIFYLILTAFVVGVPSFVVGAIVASASCEDEIAYLCEKLNRHALTCDTEEAR